MDININSTNKLNLTTFTASDLYAKYRGYLVPVGVILVSILIIFFILLPQIQQFFNQEQILKRENEKLSILKNNYDFLSNLSDETVDSNLNALSLALPANKNFAGIVNEISTSSIKSGVSVMNFNFQIGNLEADKKEKSKYPFLQLTVNLSGNSIAITNFVSELYKTVPTAEVLSIKVKGKSANVTILFYYKSFPTQTVSYEEPIVKLTTKENALIQQISSWNNVNFNSESFLPISLPASSSSINSPF